MAKLTYSSTAQLCLLTEENVGDIHTTALRILAEVGVTFDSENALTILKAAGCKVDETNKIVKYPAKLVNDAIEACPETFGLYDRAGEGKLIIGGDSLEITPTFSASNILLDQAGTIRSATCGDMKNIINLTNQIPEYRITIPAVVCSDIPPEHGDYYRDYMILKYSQQPMITEVWSMESLIRLYHLLLAVRGSQADLIAKPLTVVGLCPMAPLVWSREAAENLINAVNLGLPVNICACPMLGSGSPVTIAGAVAQQCAEFLSGLVLAQTVQKGAPIVFGGYSTSMDMKTMSASISATEAIMAVSAHATMAKYYGIPSQTFAECSEAKTPDYQGGWETALTGVTAALSGINLIYGCGSLDYLMEFSYEKFLIDAEVAKSLYFLKQGIPVNVEALALEAIKEVGPNNSFMLSMHTMMNFRQAQCYPAKFIDRNKRGAWENNNSLNVVAAAKPAVKEMLSITALQPANKAMAARLDQVILDINEKCNLSLPIA